MIQQMLLGEQRDTEGVLLVSLENWRKIDNVSVMNDGASTPADPVKEQGEGC